MYSLHDLQDYWPRVSRTCMLGSFVFLRSGRWAPGPACADFWRREEG